LWTGNEVWIRRSRCKEQSEDEDDPDQYDHAGCDERDPGGSHP
jgi:hypothetical protein